MDDDGSDNLRTITAVLPDGSDANSLLDLQMTEYVHAARVADGSAVNSNDLLSEVRFPQPTGDLRGTSPADVRVYRHNALGEVTRYTDQNGTVHDYAYDVLGRPTEDYASTLGSGVNGAVRRLHTSYASGGQVEFVYSEDNAGAALNTVAYAYNGLGDQKSTVFSDRSGQSHFVSYAYSEDWANNRSRLTTLTYSGGKVLTYDYGTSGSLNDKISRVNAIKEGATTLEAYSYLGLGTIVERDRPQPGVKLTYFQSGGSGDGGDAYVGLDRFGRVVDQRWVKGSSDVDRFQYTYDRSSNRLSRAVTATGAPTDLDEAYSYDSLDRLTKANRGTLASGTIADAAAVYQQTWTMDGLGNWTLFKTDSNGGAGGGATIQTRTHNRRNQLLTVSGQTAPLHDSNGNMTRDESNRTLVYDAWDRLVSVSGSGGTVTYAYDALGRRITADYGGGNKTEFVYGDDWQVLEEFNSAGVSQATYVWGLGYGDALVLRDQGSQRLYAHQDANWNVTSIADATGAVQERYVYDPYGKVTYKTATWGALASSSFAWAHLHQGGRLDAATGLYHFRNRDYSATLGRWANADPIGYGDGMNLYQAYRSGPVNFVDPLGLETWPGKGPRPEPGWKDPEQKDEFGLPIEPAPYKLPPHMLNPGPGLGYDPKPGHFTHDPEFKKWGKKCSYLIGGVLFVYMGGAGATNADKCLAFLGGYSLKEVIDLAWWDDNDEP